MTKRNLRRLLKISITLSFVLYFIFYFSFPTKLDNGIHYSTGGPPPTDTGDWYVNPEYFKQFNIDTVSVER